VLRLHDNRQDETGNGEDNPRIRKTIERSLQGSPDLLAPLKLHYLRWVVFDIGKDKYFMYQGIFDTDFDKYTEDAIALFAAAGLNTRPLHRH
jgi:hypothetical protein